jgi:hypothetical protein
MKTETLPVFLAVQLLFAAGLAWSCFCRLVKTSQDTFREVRWSIVLELVAAGAVFGAPLLPMLMPEDIRWAAWTTPWWVWLALLTAVALDKFATAREWMAGGPPLSLQQSGRRNTAVYAGVAAVSFVLLTTPREGVAQASERIAAIPQGATITCPMVDGCVLMSRATFERLVQLASRHPPL